MVELCTDVNDCKIKNWKWKSKNRADWEKCIMEVKVHLDCGAIEGGRGGGGGGGGGRAENEEEEEEDETNVT